MSDLKRTPLFKNHIAQNAKMVDFGGWEMPVQYSGIVNEHKAVREKTGIFDVSHMGEFEVQGSESLAFLQKTTANDPSKLGIGRGQYSLFLNQNGGSIDDIIVYRTGQEAYLIVVNASNIEKDWTHVSRIAGRFDSLILKNASQDYGLIALQGPLAESTLQKHVDRDLGEIGFFRIRQANFEGVRTKIARTGYTGEGVNGFEIFTATTDASTIWDTLVQNESVTPCGLGARDTLRIEASLPLYGHELDDETSPIEAGLDIFVSHKNDYIGSNTIQMQRAKGTAKTLVMLEMVDRGIPRQGYTVCNDKDEHVGLVTSGTVAPWVDKIIAMAYISPNHAVIGSDVFVEIRNKKIKAKIVPRPFFKR